MSLATIASSNSTPIDSIDASTRSRSVFDRMASRQPCSFASASAGACVLEDRPARQRSRERARFAFRQREVLLVREPLERRSSAPRGTSDLGSQPGSPARARDSGRAADRRPRHRRASRAPLGCPRSNRRSCRSSRRSPSARPRSKPSLPSMVEIRALTESDWPRVEEIYAEGIATGDATFETKPPDWAEFDRTRLRDHRLVAVDAGEIVGWAALSADVDPRVLPRRRRALRLRRGGRPRPRRWPGAPRGARLRRRRSRPVDDPDEHLPRERGEPRPPRTGRLQDRRPARAHRSARRSLARHDPPRAPLVARAMTGPVRSSPTPGACRPPAREARLPRPRSDPSRSARSPTPR